MLRIRSVVFKASIYILHYCMLYMEVKHLGVCNLKNIDEFRGKVKNSTIFYLF